MSASSATRSPLRQPGVLSRATRRRRRVGFRTAHHGCHRSLPSMNSECQLRPPGRPTHRQVIAMTADLAHGSRTLIAVILTTSPNRERTYAMSCCGFGLSPLATGRRGGRLLEIARKGAARRRPPNPAPPPRAGLTWQGRGRVGAGRPPQAADQRPVLARLQAAARLSAADRRCGRGSP
jgi:hypothetical protein